MLDQRLRRWPTIEPSLVNHMFPVHKPEQDYTLDLFGAKLIIIIIIRHHFTLFINLVDCAPLGSNPRSPSFNYICRIAGGDSRKRAQTGYGISPHSCSLMHTQGHSQTLTDTRALRTDVRFARMLHIHWIVRYQCWIYGRRANPASTSRWLNVSLLLPIACDTG